MWNIHKNKKDLPEVEVTVSNRTVLRIILLILVTIAMVDFYLKITHAILLLFIAFFLALALNSPVAKIAKLIPGKKKGSRPIATTVAYLFVVVILVAFVAYLIPPIVRQTEKFMSAAPGIINSAKDQSSALGHFVRAHHLGNELNSLSKQVAQRFQGFSGSAFSSIRSVLNSFVSVIAVLVLTFMMLVEGPRWVNIFKELFVPSKGKETFEHIVGDMYKVVKGYVNGQVVLALIAAALMAPALFMLGIGYPVALMVVIFLTGLIPLIGHPIGAVIVTVVALFHSVSAALILLAIYILYINIENYLLQPRIQANTTNMPPLLVFASIIIGINFGGIIGALVAIPVAGCLRVLVLEYLSKKRMLPVDFIKDST